MLQAHEPSARYLETSQPELLRHFELLAGAEGGVARLREFILTLAVEGKLVPQFPSEASASDTLAKARAVAVEQRSQRRKSAAREIGPLESDSDSPTLPRGWEWCRGVDLYTVVRGVNYQKADASGSQRADYLPILRANNIRNTVNFDDLVYVPGSLVNEEQLLRPGDFVVCLASGSKNLVGKAAMFTGETACSFGAFCGAIRLAVPLPFFSVFLASPLYRNAVSVASSGIGINNLKSSTLLGLSIALPPEAEQSRIVARVDELMRLCDALEAKDRLAAEQHARLLDTLLGTLTDSSTPEELAANWQRVADHFDLLLDRPEAVDALEQVILQLGLRGVLLPKPLLQDRSTKQEQQGSSRSDPYSWPTVAFSEVLRDLRYGTSAKCSYERSGTPVLRIPNLHDGAIDISDLKLGDLEPKEADNLRLEVGDLLIIRSNGSAGLVGTAALVSSPLPGFAFAGYLVRARLDRAKVVPHFMALVMRSPEVRRQIEGPIRTTSGVKNINSTEIQRISFTLPPLEVQDLIVHTVTELRRLCANLQERLDRCNAVQAALADALIDQTLVA